jgi:chromosome partitioning protein
MPVIAVVNRKGGSGKSTLAAHIAVWCARQGHSVMLGDVDRQQSSRTWLKRRDPALPSVAPWALDQKNVLRVPTGITHVVLDTPGGLHGFELARVVMFADAIIMPVCHSVFDRESAAACHAELMALPRVASGRCRLATVGMRIDGRTSAGQVLRDWSTGLKLPFLGVLRETQVYVRCLERGLTIFDLTPSQAAADLAQWQPILEWMTPLLNPVQAANDPTPVTRAVPVTRAAPVTRARRPHGTRSMWRERPSRLGNSRPASLMPAQESLVHGGRLSAFAASTRPAAVPAQPVNRPSLPRAANPADAQQIPQFLKRGG